MSAVAQTSVVEELKARVSTLEDVVKDLKGQLDRLQLQSALERGREEADRGLGAPAEEVVGRLRKKYNLPA